MQKISVKGEQNYPIIDLYRWIFLCFVCAAHLSDTFRFCQMSSFAQDWRFLNRFGVLSLPLFFSLSGFLISRIIDRRNSSMFKPDLKNFYVGRIARILPLLLISQVIGAALIWAPVSSEEIFKFIIGEEQLHSDWSFWVSINMFTYNWYRIFNDHLGLWWQILWSLSVEEQFYLFFPLLLLFCGSAHKLTAMLLVIITATWGWRIFIVLFGQSSSLLYSFGTFSNTDYIAAGCLSYLFDKNYCHILKNNKSLATFLLVLTTAALLILSLYSSQHKVLLPPVVAGLFFTMILCCIHSHWPKGILFKFLAYPGKAIYGGYLWHPLVLLVSWPILQRQAHFLIALSFYLVFVLLTGLLSWWLIERPIQSWILRKFTNSKSNSYNKIQQQA